MTVFGDDKIFRTDFDFFADILNLGTPFRVGQFSVRGDQFPDLLADDVPTTGCVGVGRILVQQFANFASSFFFFL